MLLFHVIPTLDRCKDTYYFRTEDKRIKKIKKSRSASHFGFFLVYGFS